MQPPLTLTSNGRAAEHQDSAAASDPPGTPSGLLRPPDAAKWLACSPRTLWSLTAPRGPLSVVRIGRAVRYDVRDLQAYVNGAKGAVSDAAEEGGLHV